MRNVKQFLAEGDELYQKIEDRIKELLTEIKNWDYEDIYYIRRLYAEYALLTKGKELDDDFELSDPKWEKYMPEDIKQNSFRLFVWFCDKRGRCYVGIYNTIKTIDEIREKIKRDEWLTMEEWGEVLRNAREKAGKNA